MRKNIVLPGVAIVGGLVGLGLRRWELATAFDPETGLHVASGATPALLIWTALVALAILALSRDCQNSQPYDRAFHAENSTVVLTALVLSGFLLLLSGGMEVMVSSVSEHGMYPSGLTMLSRVLRPLRTGLCIVGFGCVLVMGKNLFRARGKGVESLSVLGLCLLFCVWLISEYQSRAADPILLHYAYSIFAILAAMLGLYYLAGYSFQTGKPRCTVFFGLLAVYLSLVTLADRHTLAELLRYGFVVLFLTTHAVLLLREHSAGELPTETEDIHNV